MNFFILFLFWVRPWWIAQIHSLNVAHTSIYIYICAWTFSLWKIFVTYSFAKSKLQRSSNFLYQALAKSLLKVIRSNIFFSAWFFGAMFIMKHWHIKQYLNIQRAALNLRVSDGVCYEIFCQKNSGCKNQGIHQLVLIPHPPSNK